MKATTNIDKAEIIFQPTTGFDGDDNTIQGTEQGQSKGKPESELRAAARRRGGAAST